MSRACQPFRKEKFFHNKYGGKSGFLQRHLQEEFFMLRQIYAELKIMEIFLLLHFETAQLFSVPPA